MAGGMRRGGKGGRRDEAAAMRSRAAGNRRAWLALRRRVLAANEWSEAYRAERIRRLRWLCAELEALGVALRGAESLRGEHVDALVRAWRSRGVSGRVVENRLAALRWWAVSIGRPGIVKDNETYGTKTLAGVKGVVGEAAYLRILGRVVDPCVKVSLALQWEFGLSPAESVRLRPADAARDAGIFVRAAWGGRSRGRMVGLRWESQREAFDAAARVATKGGVVLAGRTVAEQEAVYRWEVERLRVSREHGVRYAFARRLAREATGLACPAEGGPQRGAMAPEARRALGRAVWTAAREMGVSRGRVRHVFLGYEDEEARRGDGSPDVAAELRVGYFAARGVPVLAGPGGAAR